jgi:hypothetical protein
MYAGPPSRAIGKILTAAEPAARACHTSVGVAAPGMAATPSSLARSGSQGSHTGDTKKVAPASTALRT